MKNLSIFSVQFLSFLLLLNACSESAVTQDNAGQQQIYQIRIYHFDNPDQEQQVDAFLKEAYLPGLHRAGIEPVGVFKPVGQDTTPDRRTYVLIPFDSFTQMDALPATLKNDSRYQSDGSAYIQAPYDQPPYRQIESILLKAFTHAPRIQTPDLNGTKSQRIYELRSYESSTEAINKNKVEMFNEGGEVEIFRRLGFNAVFYGNVIAGSHMPNLMYMTTFEDMKSRDAHWDAFRNDPQWEELSSMEKYQNNVSGSDIFLLYPTEYSDL